MTVTTRPLMQPTLDAKTRGSRGGLTWRLLARGDEKNGAADSEREDSWLARKGPRTRMVESKDGLEVVDAVAVAALDTDTRGVDGCAAPGDSAGVGYTASAPEEPERNKGEHHLILRRYPRHRKHTMRRVGC